MRKRTFGVLAAVGVLLGTMVFAATPARAVGSGLNAEYFATTDGTFWRGDVRLNRIDATVDFSWPWWSTCSPDASVPCDFSARWTGKVEPAYSQTYTFHVTADDAVRLWVNNVLVIDRWNGPAGTYTGTIALTANAQVPIRLEFRDTGWDGSVKLEWSSASQPRQVVPSSRLYPAPRPPAQATSGPGSSSYPNGGCQSTFRDMSGSPNNNVDLSYYTYEPRTPTPANAPLVVFLHGFGGYDPANYIKWITHLCRKGNIVVFPYYGGLFTPPAQTTGNAIWAVKDAITYMNASAQTKPNTSLGMVLIGHSLGAGISAEMANQYAAQGLPTPKAIFAVKPGVCPNGCGTLSGIPTSTYIDCLVGDYDFVVSRIGCDSLWTATSHMPAANRSYLWQWADGRGGPQEAADHYTFVSSSSLPGGQEYYGYYKIGDALRDCGLFGTSCTYATGGGSNVTNQGSWSDGVAVTPMTASQRIRLPLRINAGAGLLQTTPGPNSTNFSMDQLYTGTTSATGSTGNTIDTSAPNAAPQMVYQSNRYESWWRTVNYVIGGLAPNTSHTVRLHWAESYFNAAGQRRFHVDIQGTRVETNLDVIAAAGGANKALVRTYTATSNASGAITIAFPTGAADNPFINGIEIL